MDNEYFRKVNYGYIYYNQLLFITGKGSSSSDSDESSSDSSSLSNRSDSNASGQEVQAPVTVDAPLQQPYQDPVIPLDILGTNPLAAAAVGPEVHAEIANRWTTFCRTGIDKLRKNISSKSTLDLVM